MENPENLDEQMHERGQEAEQFLKFTQEGNQYFLKLMSELERELYNNLMGLRPWQKEEFAVLKAQLETLYEPLKRVHVDIELGKQAWDRMNGTEDPKEGIL